MAAELPTAVLLRRMADLSARGEQVDPTVLRSAADELGRTARALGEAKASLFLTRRGLEAVAAEVDQQGMAVELLRRWLGCDWGDWQQWSDVADEASRFLDDLDRPHEQEGQ